MFPVAITKKIQNINKKNRSKISVASFRVSALCISFVLGRCACLTQAGFYVSSPTFSSLG